MNKSRVSAVIPYYEAHETIRSALTSLLEGELPPDEIIIVNDGSSEDSRGHLEDVVFQLGQRSITIIDHRYNLGGGFARNTAVFSARNELIFCLDADNLIPKSLLGSLTAFVEHNSKNIDVAAPERVIFFDDALTKVSHSWTFRDGNLLPQDYLNRSVLPGASGNYLFSKKSWYKSGGYPTGTRALDAWGFGFRQQLAGFQAYVVPETFYFHRIGLPSYYVRESSDMQQLSLFATALILENSPNLTPALLKNFLSHSRAKSWLKKVKPPTVFGDPKLRLDEGFTTPSDLMEPKDLKMLELSLAYLEHGHAGP